MPQSAFYCKTMISPVGTLKLVASEKGLCAVLFAKGRDKQISENPMARDESHSVLKKAEAQLAEYFAGKRKKFDLPLDMRGSIFQIRAWRELQKIPYGKTISYGEQAKRVGDAKKARAMGMANGRNPLAIIVPCHRVIGADGTLTGFGGGLKTKEYLINLERRAA